MAAEAVALLKEFYSTGNPKGEHSHSGTYNCMSLVPSLCYPSTESPAALTWPPAHRL